MDNFEDEERIREVVAVTCASIAHVATIFTAYFSFNLPREPYVRHVAERNVYIDSIIYNDEKCRKNLRMGMESFHRLCLLVREKGLLEDTRNCQVEEILMRFLHLLGHDVRYSVMSGRFFRSQETICRQFNEVLVAVLKLYPCLVANHGEAIHGGGTPSVIVSDVRYAQYFKDCLGALDGTHIRATVPKEDVKRFRSGRKDFTSQNALAACSFDLKFTYVLVGWEGTAHDQRVLDNARTRPNPFVIPSGKYYLGDAGYDNEPGVLTPYRNTRYHISEYITIREPRNFKELYNKRHSQLRNTIERAFGVLKKRWPMLSARSHYSYKSQVKIAMACFILHNHIMGVDPKDPIIEETDKEILASRQQVGSSSSRNSQEQVNPSSSNSQRPTFRAEQARWLQFRDNTANKMYIDYQNYKQRRNAGRNA